MPTTPAETLVQDLRLLDLLQKHPELNEPAGVNLRDRLATLCESQGETASPARIAETVVDYLNDQPLATSASNPISWKRPRTAEERNAAVEAINEGWTAQSNLDRFNVLARCVRMASATGFFVACLTLPLWVALALGLVTAGIWVAPRFLKKNTIAEWRARIQKREETLQTWAVETPAGEAPLTCPRWATNVPGWELNGCSVTPFGMKRFKKSPRAVAAFRALQAQPVPLLNIDVFHIERLADQDKAAFKKSKEEAMRREWQELIQQPQADPPVS